MKVFLRHKVTFIFTFIFLLALAAPVFAIDAPHTEAMNVACNSCHSHWNDQPGATIDETSMNKLCRSCHDGGTGITAKVTHSGITTSSETSYGQNWTTQCIDCHDPHFQKQSITYRGDYSAGGAYLETFIIGSFAQNNGVTNVIIASTNPGWAVDQWQGYSVVVGSRRLVTYRVASNTANSIILSTAPGKSIYTGSRFAVPGDQTRFVYGKMIRDQVRTPRAVINSSGVLYNGSIYRDVKYLNSSGPYSPAASMSDEQALCVVCHTRTAVNNIGYLWGGNSYDSNASASHNDRTSMTQSCWQSNACHEPPANGFDANCSGCHGAPPVDLATMVNTPTLDKTGRTNSGKHAVHQAKGFDSCDYCHAGGGPAGADGHSNSPYQLTMGFSYGLSQGTYDATNKTLPNDPSFTMASGDAGTTVNYSGATSVTGGTCSNIYCHSDGTGVAGQFRTVTWLDSEPSLACDSCHGDQAGTLVTTAKHPRHTDGAAGNYTYQCYECHDATVDSATLLKAGSKTHVNTVKDVSFGNISAGGSYATNCSNIYCHSDAQGGFKSPAWSDGATTCTSCHDTGGAATALSGAHGKHTPGYGCADCHSATVSDNSTISAGGYAKHVNKAKDVVPTGFGADGNDFDGATKSCSTLDCHGTKSPSWTTDFTGVDSCTRCHGEAVAGVATEAQKAPGGAGTDTGGDSAANDAEVGAHQAHLTSASNYTNNVACADCHSVPATVQDAGHIDSVLPAELAFSPFAANFGSLTPSYNPVTGVCSNVYCHGANMPKGSNNGADIAPVWNGVGYLSSAPSDNNDGTGDCEKCHGSPPNLKHAGDETLSGAKACGTCHTHFNDGGTLNDFSLHMNGLVEGGCESCHGQPPYNAATMVNSNASLGITGRTVDFAGTSQGAHVLHNVDKAIACEVCHNGGGSSGQHNAAVASEVTMGFLVNGIAGGSYDAPAISNANYSLGFGPSTTVTTTGPNRTCSTIYCHSDGGDYAGTFTYATPDWDAAGPLACDSCHGGAGEFVDNNVHPIHVSTYNFKCSTCHTDTVDDTNAIIGNHVNFQKNVAFKAGSQADGGNYTRPDCSNIYCHSQGTVVFAAPNNTPSWNTGTLDCTGCHNNTALSGSAMATGTHTSHINNSAAIGNNFSCVDCHAATVDTDTSIVDPAYHVNGVANVIVNATYGGSYSASQCSTVYCHSDGNSDGTPVYKTVTWGVTETTCTSCHGDGSTKAYPSYADGGAATGASNSHNKHVGASNVQCEQCHAGTSVNGTAIDGATPAMHVNMVNDVSFKQGGAYDSAAETCSTTYCHGAGASPAWGTVGGTNCGTCHSGSSLTLPGSHATHFGNTSTATSADMAAANISNSSAYMFTCAVCHDGANHAGGEVGVDQAAEVIFNATIAGSGTHTPGVLAGNDNGFNYTSGTCSTTYCHSKGEGTAGNVTPQWGVTAMTCESCHNYDAAATNKMATGSHTSHINNSTTVGSNYGCQECHNSTTTDGASIADKSFHVSGSPDVSIVKGGTWTGGANECGNAYCHSTGKDLEVPIANLPGAYGASHYSTMTWGAGDIDCAGCHGKTSAVAGMPDYTGGGAGALDANSHGKHVSSSADCAKCHADTTSDGAAIKAGSTLHTNQSANINIAALYDTNGGSNSDNYNSATKTCSSISCHGAGAPQWGGTVSCQSCHVAAADDVDDYVYNNGTTAVINSTEWTSVGHGKTTATLPLGCDSCHDSASNHGDGTNPFRLLKTDNNACWDCHSTGSVGVGGKNSTVKVDKFHQMASHTQSGNDGGKFCWDCHDPHGDDANIQMIQARAARKTDGVYGNPGSVANLTAASPNQIVFTDNTLPTGAGGFAMNSTSGNFTKGVCNACHTASAATPKMQHYNSTASDDHNQGTLCLTCHQHSSSTTKDGNAFQGAGNCDSCHGYPPEKGDGLDSYNFTLEGKSVSGGAHLKHVQHLEIVNGVTRDAANDTFGTGTAAILCGVCHTNDSAVDHMSGTRNINFGGNTTYQFGPSAPQYNGTEGQTEGASTFKSCSNVSCHFKETPGWHDPALSGN